MSAVLHQLSYQFANWCGRMLSLNFSKGLSLVEMELQKQSNMTSLYILP